MTKKKRSNGDKTVKKWRRERERDHLHRFPVSPAPFNISNNANGVLQMIIISRISILVAIPKDLFSAIISIFPTSLLFFSIRYREYVSFAPFTVKQHQGWCYLNRYLHKAKEKNVQNIRNARFNVGRETRKKDLFQPFFDLFRSLRSHQSFQHHYWWEKVANKNIFVQKKKTCSNKTMATSTGEGETRKKNHFKGTNSKQTQANSTKYVDSTAEYLPFWICFFLPFSIIIIIVIILFSYRCLNEKTLNYPENHSNKWWHTDDAVDDDDNNKSDGSQHKKHTDTQNWNLSHGIFAEFTANQRIRKRQRARANWLCWRICNTIWMMSIYLFNL